MEYHILNTCFEYIFIFKAVLTHLKRSRPLLVLGAVRRQQQGAPLVNKVMQQQWLERTEGGRTGAVQLTHQQEKQRQEARQAQQYVPVGIFTEMRAETPCVREEGSTAWMSSGGFRDSRIRGKPALPPPASRSLSMSYCARQLHSNLHLIVFESIPLFSPWIA